MKITRDDATWMYSVEWDDGRRQQLASVTTIIDAALGQFQGFTLDQLQDMFRDGERAGQIAATVAAVMDRVRNAGAFGRAVHSLTELDDQGILDEDSLDPALKLILAAWKKFKVDCNPIMCCAEHSIASKLGYAGTLDRIATMDGKPVLLEIKSRPYKAGRDGLQTIAYQKAYEEMTKTKISKRYVIELTLGGDYKLTETKDRQDWDMFRCALAIFNWREKHG